MSDIKELQNNIKDLEKQIDSLESENKELKKKLHTYTNRLKMNYLSV